MREIEIRLRDKAKKTSFDSGGEIDEMERTGQQAGGLSNLPSISVGSDEQVRDIIHIKFDSEPIEKTKKDGKPIAYADVTVLKPHEGYDRTTQKAIPLAEGERATINLKRHANLWNFYLAVKPVIGKSYAIATVGKVKTKRGSAYDIRYKQLEA